MCKKVVAPQVSPQPKSLTVGGTFTGKLPQADGLSGALWESSASGKASVDGASGKVTAISAGSATITGYYTKPSKIKGAEYTVTVNGINVTPEAKSIAVGGTFTGALPTQAGCSGQTWESSDVGKASVVAGTGVVTGVQAGQATITGYFTKPSKIKAKEYTVTVTGGES